MRRNERPQSAAICSAPLRQRTPPVAA
jgi:hypothetical protein